MSLTFNVKCEDTLNKSEATRSDNTGECVGDQEDPP